MRRLTVLLVAHNPEDVRLTQQIFAQTSPHHTLRVVRDGEEALTYLFQEGVYTAPSSAPPPDIILLDLPLPCMSGQELLQRLKQDPRFKRLPVIILASSRCAEEIGQAYAAGANAYLQKPAEMAGFTEVIEQLEKFWLETVELPQ